MRKPRDKSSAAVRPAVAAAATAPTPGQLTWKWLLLIGLLALLPLLWPGDAQWLNDEPNLINRALLANQQGTLAERGLRGTVGLDYGPFPIWIYQALLSLTHNAVALVAIRAALVSLATAASLLWLARTLALRPAFIAVILLSPYLWLFSRALWDNTFCIPLSALLLASYADCRERPRAWSLAVSAFCMGGMMLTHMMSLPIVAAVCLHMLLRRRIPLRTLAAGVPVVLSLAAMAWPYFRYLVSAKVVNDNPVGPEVWLFTLLGGRFLSASGLDRFFQPEWFEAAGSAMHALFTAAVFVSLAGIGLVWVGMVLAGVDVARAFRQRSSTARVELMGVCLAAWLLQALLNGIARTALLPHYFNASWICYALLAWHAVDRFGGRRWTPPALAAYGAAMAFVLAFLIIRVHATHGSRLSYYGPSIATQWEIARQLNAFEPDTRIFFDTRLARDYPQAMLVLRKLDSARPGALKKSRGELHVRYRLNESVDAELGVYVPRPRPPASVPTR